MNTKNLITIITLLSLIFLVSCKGEEMAEKIDPFPSIKDIPAANWEKLAQKNIYFGHQSVGANIIVGIEDLMKENLKIKLNIVKTKDPNDFIQGIFAHSGIGKNGYPKTKIDDYANLIDNGIGKKADIAFFKLCYVDIRTETEVGNVFSEYKKVMSKLMDDYPGTEFVHVTVPLTTEKTLLQSLSEKITIKIKKIMGKPAWSLPRGNKNRNLLNEMIIQEYKGKAPIFDLANVESTFVDGTRSTFNKDGITYYSMVPEYTTDGGHLNDLGRKIVAEQLLIFLANQI